LHDNIYLAAKFKLRYAVIVQISLGVFKNKLVFLETNQHVCNLIAIYAGRISLSKALLTLLRKHAFDLVVIIAHEEVIVSFGDVGSKRTLVFLMEIDKVTFRF
jgi:hypothetical protein